MIETAIAGMPLTEVLPLNQGRRRCAVGVRYAPELRDDPAALERVLVTAADGRVVPLGQVTHITTHRRRVEDGTLRTHADLLGAIVDGAARRIRPKLMTIHVNIVGLAPVIGSTNIGSDVMRPIAVPLFGGVVTSLLLELTAYTAIFAIWKGYRQRGGALPGPPATTPTDAPLVARLSAPTS